MFNTTVNIVLQALMELNFVIPYIYPAMPKEFFINSGPITDILKENSKVKRPTLKIIHMVIRLIVDN